MRSQGFWTNDVVRSCMVVFHFVFAVLLLQLYLITSSSLAFAFRFLLVVGTVKFSFCQVFHLVIKSKNLVSFMHACFCSVNALYVAKLYDINAELVEDKGFLESLKDLISDNNPMMVANVVATLVDDQENSCSPIFEIPSHTLSKLLTALNECTECKAVDGRETEKIVERATPRFQHANCAVVLSVVKLITSTDVVQNLCKKMAPPIVTLLSAEPKIQYVALWNINLIVQRRPTILAHEFNALLQALICGIGYLEQPVLT
ncbi:hypothetical protein JHK85_032298 [Glycine max]|nr:hypothetical protein JHK85_032298 [Glycine max]